MESNYNSNQVVEALLSGIVEKLKIKQNNDVQMRGCIPCYPVCVFFVGKRATMHYQDINNKIKLFWPAYMKGIKYFYTDDIRSFKFSIIKDGLKHEGEMPWMREIESLFGFENKDLSSNAFQAYVIYESDDIVNENEVDVLFEQIMQFKNELKNLDREFRLLVFHVINEQCSEVSYKIKKYLQYENKFSEFSNCIFSNRLSNGRFIAEQEDDRYELIASVIAISDDGNHGQYFMKKGEILTAKYSKIVKNYKVIASAILKSLMEKICICKNDVTMLFPVNDSMQFSDLLGLSRLCKFSILEKIVNNKDFKVRNYLSYLPNETSEAVDLHHDMTVRQINNSTMGALDALLNYVSNQIVDDLLNNKSRLKEEYKKELLSRMNIYQLSYIKKNIDLIKKRIEDNVIEINEDSKLNEVENQILLSYVAKNVRSGLIFYDSLEEVSTSASKCVETIDELLYAITSITECESEWVYYMVKNQVDEYLNNNLDAVVHLFQLVELEELEQSIKVLIENVLQLPVFRKDMYELIQTMYDENVQETIEYIWDKLHTELMDRQYLDTRISLSSPNTFIIIASKESKIYECLNEDKQQKGYDLFDVGARNIMESIAIYSVPKNLVMRGEINEI